MQEEKCCAVSCDRPIDEQYWNQQYLANTTGWDLGEVAPAIKSYVNALPSKDLAILIPGCGNAYEAAYLLEQGFTHITLIDIAPLLVENLRRKFAGTNRINIIQGDFFAHHKKYDLILEHTFFCALPPQFRPGYVAQMHALLNPGGILAGLIFDRDFEAGPPFGGNREDYVNLFRDAFLIRKMETCQNSVEKRTGTELFFEMEKNQTAVVRLFAVEGVNCSSCGRAITEKLMTLTGVLHCNMSSDFSRLFIVSTAEIPLVVLQREFSEDKAHRLEAIETAF